jgi:AraC-like DNA-binding protein
MSATVTPAARRFSTWDLPERERLSRWREEFGRNIALVEIETLSDEAIHAQATMQALPGLRTLLFNGSAMRMSRTPALAALGDDSLGLIIARDADAALSHRGIDLPLGYGDACPVIADEAVVIAARGHFNLLFPRVSLVARVKNFMDIAATRIPQDRDALRLLISYLNALSGKMALGSPKLQDTVVEHIYDLVALAIWPDRPADENSLSATAAARLQLALSYINMHFEAPGLTISAVARNQNVSPRYLQRLIETTGSTFSERVNELRLQRAHALLTDVHNRQDRISDIALRAGFSDIAHFNRSFRRRFGATPRDIRAGANVCER